MLTSYLYRLVLGQV